MNELSLTERALRVACAAHAGQKRKADDSPYIIHPVMVAILLAQHGFDESVVAAALVHDVLEDTSVTEDELRRQLPGVVVDTVVAVSEDKDLSWEERKKAYREAVRNGSPAARAVSIADKVHNAQSLLAAHASQGSALWEKFNRGKERKLWFEQEMLKVFQETWQHALVDEYAALVRQIEVLD